MAVSAMRLKNFLPHLTYICLADREINLILHGFFYMLKLNIRSVIT